MFLPGPAALSSGCRPSLLSAAFGRYFRFPALIQEVPLPCPGSVTNLQEIPIMRVVKSLGMAGNVDSSMWRDLAQGFGELQHTHGRLLSKRGNVPFDSRLKRSKPKAHLSAERQRNLRSKRGVDLTARLGWRYFDAAESRLPRRRPLISPANITSLS